MQKIDILIGLLGVFSYIAIMMDIRSYEHKMAQFDAIQEKRRFYVQKLAEQRKMEKVREKAEAKRKEKKSELAQMAGIVEKLGAMQDEEVMKKSKITSGKIG